MNPIIDTILLSTINMSTIEASDTAIESKVNILRYLSITCTSLKIHQ